VLRFLCQPPARSPVLAGNLEETLHTSLALAFKECEGRHGDAGRVLVIDADVNPAPSAPGLGRAVLNVIDGRYLPPEAVPAAGGYVVRRTPDGIDVLLIHRRGAWDLPKGKLDRGESPEACALREVAEEIGIPQSGLRLGHSLGTTVHGYRHPRRNTYAVKTTYWYAMTTGETEFSPQGDEGIERVEWVPWSEAGARLDFETLREHHAGVDATLLGL
jgi:8-oxo-dGTP pyrophosphatase MutT (NUDIX family)